jgi:hypothetical protein
MTIWLNQLEWLFLHHIGMITEHFRVRLEEYFFQPLQVTHIKKIVRSDKTTTYPISFVECLGHYVQTVRDEAVKAK